MAFEYAPAPESRSVVDIAPSYGLFIDGEFVDAAGGAAFTTDQPGHRGGARRRSRGRRRDDVDRAVAAARAAYDAGLGPDERPRPRPSTCSASRA